MPVPETRRYGGREETSYTSSYTRSTGRTTSYLPSSYSSSSKYGSSALPPRPPAYDRKFSDNISSTLPTSRFLSSTRTSGNYGTTSSFGRTSVSPVRAISSTLRMPSVTDRVKSLEPDVTPTRYSRLRETSSSLNSKSPSTYNGYTRDRSGSRELGTSPLTGSSVSLGSREIKSRSASIGPSSSSTTSSNRQRNGLSRLASVEVTQSNESSSSTTTPPPTSNEKDGVESSSSGGLTAACASDGGQAIIMNIDKCKDVENNDRSFNDDNAVASPLLASGAPAPLTTITTNTTTTSAIVPTHSLNYSQVQANNTYINGNSNIDNSHDHKQIRPSVRSKIIINQDKNGNQIPIEHVNGYSSSLKHFTSDSNNTNNFNSKIPIDALGVGDETSLVGGTTTKLLISKSSQTQASRQPKVIYHKIHIVQSEEVDKKSPSPVLQQVQNGESTNTDNVAKCHGNENDNKIVENGESPNLKESNHEDSMKKNLTTAGKHSLATAPPAGVTKLLKSQPDLSELPIEKVILNSRSKSKSPSPIVRQPETKESFSSDTNCNPESRSSTPTALPTPSPGTTSLLSNNLTVNGESHNVGEMAGPHASKYHRGEDEIPGTSKAAAAALTYGSTSRRGGEEKGSRGHTYESDSSENDSDAYTSSPQLGGRFRSREKDSQCGLTGLRNIGNTCFMNSVLQCLSNTKPLLEYLLTDNYISDINSTSSSMKGALIRAFANVIQELWRESRTVDTSAFKDQIQRFAPRFMGYSQQDAQEFLRYLLEGLHEEINRVTTKPKPIVTDIDESLSDAQKSIESWKRYLRSDDSKIVDIFVGQFKSTLKCTTCGHCSVTFDPFWDLSLPIPARSNQTRLSQCLELFAREETLDGDEKPTCAKCQTRRKCTKSLSIQRFPKVLVIHLKRFAPSERFRGKLSTTVEFPLNGLDMTPYAANRAQGCSYNLYGISNHSGSTYSGHYIAYCKHPKTGEWNTYNDSRVSPISSQSVSASEGYVLFYELANQSSHL